ncbi:MAG: ECF transporter S component [Candidatus Bathyarchaeia archaeon]
MNLPNHKQNNSNLKIATIDLVLMAMFASLGLATKNILYPLIGPLIGAIYVPTGSVTGGLYMMWPVMAFGLIRKTGTATMVSLIQATISLVLPYGNFGALSFLIYLGPGVAIDGFYLIIRHKACCLGCCMIASSIANVVGTLLVGSLVLFLPTIVLTFLIVVAAISGLIGGFIANLILARLSKIGFIDKFR